MKRIIWLGFIFILFTLIPFLLWGNLYFVGGDDSKLYYLFPFEYFKNFTLSLVSDNQLGTVGNYFSEAYISLFSLLILGVKNLFFFLNTQFLMFGLNLSLGFLFFYLLLGIWIKNDNWYDFWAKILASLAYTFSIFSFYTLWSSQLFSLYLVSIFPISLYLFIRAIQDNRPSFIVFNALLLTIFSVLLFSIPWVAALIIAVIPLLTYIFWQNRKRFMIVSLVLIVLIALLNFYWLFHFFYASYNLGKGNRDIITKTVSHDTRRENEYLIKSVSKNNQIVYPLLNLFHKNIQRDFGWPSYNIFLNWHLKLLPFNIIFPLIVILAGLFLKKTKRKYSKLYFLSLLSWLIVIFFFTVNIGGWGLNLFLWLNEHVPGFVMFRNMYDKFGLAMAFSFAFLLGVSLKIIFDQIQNRSIKTIIIILLTGLVMLNAKPFISGEYSRTPLWLTKNSFTPISDFNQDFYDLLAYIKKIDTSSRFLWLPLNNANYILIHDKKLQNHYYVGVSPLQFLARKTDFNGLLSFPPDLSLQLLKNIFKQNYKEVGLFFQRMNVKYIIVNNNASDEIKKSYLYGYYSRGDLYNAQGENLKKAILGRKISDFGRQYSLYEINSDFKNEKIYLTNNLNVIPRDFLSVTYKKLASYKYEIKIKNLKGEKYLVFLDPYQRQWNLYFSKNNRPFLTGSHEIVFDYANGWLIDPEKIKNAFPKDYYHLNSDRSIDLILTLYFKPHDYFYAGILVSSITGICLILYLIYELVTKLYNKKTLKVKTI